MLPAARLEALISRHAMIEAELSTALPRDQFVKLSREFAELGPVVESVKALKEAQAELAGIEALLDDPQTEPEMARLASEEKAELARRLAELEGEVRLALIPKDAMDERDVILEIRAGTGGDEAALFAGDLFRMYERYAALQGWKAEIVSMSEGSKGGFKEIIAAIHGHGAYAKLKFESGVHRVQRVPDTVENNLMLPIEHLARRNIGLTRADLAGRLENCFAKFPLLRERRRAKAGDLSGGQQKMVEFAKAYLQQPRLCLIDEPSIGLAPKVAEEVYHWINLFAAEKMAILLVDHNVRRVVRMSSYIYVLSLGEITAQGKPEDFAGDLHEQVKGWLGINF